MAGSVEGALRQMIREELELQLRPVRALLEGLEPWARLLAWTPQATPRPVGAQPQQGCAIRGCGKPARSKGYCASHYQKRRNLLLKRKLPPSWKANAAPGSVDNVVLPRGRAASKAYRLRRARGARPK